MGMNVFEFEGNDQVGSVASFYDNGAQDVLVIKTATKKIEVPLVESFVPVIDIEENRIEIIIPKWID